MDEHRVLNLDEDQYAAYLADQNVTVSAGAGSGKTTVLAERYVRLVTQGGLNVNEVLTLTFTRKAAAEMYTRIFKRLSASPDPQAQERLTQFDQARISTLDSFCAAITRGASYRYGISGDFRIDETELQRTAEETAVEVIMRHRRDEALCRLVAARSFEIIVQDLFADLALSAFSFVQPGAFALKSKQQIDFLKQETEQCCYEITEICQRILAIHDVKDKAGASKPGTVKKAQSAVSSRLPLKAAFDTDTINALIETAKYFISAASFSLPRSNVKDMAQVELREAALPLKKEKAPRLLSLAQTLCFQEDILLIGNVLDEYETLFLERKRAQGLLSFRDTAELAVDMLTRDQELRGYYKQHSKAIMIDEFQDNNSLQKKLLYLLAERDDAGCPGAVPTAEDLAPDKLFFVGDEKQSIYRFRGADVSVFRGLAQELGKGQEAAIKLSTNYRSAPELVDFFNALFPGVFGKAEALFEAEFAPMIPSPSKKRHAPDAPPVVELFVQETQRGDQDPGEEENTEISRETAEALSAAKRIIAGVEQGEFGFGDVAVLFRSTTHQNEYERTFRQAGIPFSAADPRGLFSEGPANDFYAILRLSLFPADRNAYATVLRSPFVKLGDESVFKIMLENPDEPFSSDPRESWFSHPSEQERYEQGREIFTQLRNRIDLQSIALVLAYLWYETGYRTYLLYDENSRPNLEHFEYLYALALEADQRRLTIGAFLDELAPRIGTTDKTETGDIPELKDRVLFITVHKSKGLEFPVVILANAGSAGRGDVNDKPYFLDPEYGPVINLKSDTAKRDDKPINYFYTFLRRELTQRQEEAELKRLFYVAATRAKERLIIVGSRELNKQDEDYLDLEGAERLRALIEGGHFNSEGELQKKSFLDLFSCGILGAAGPIPDYRLVPIATPTQAAYWKAIKLLHKRTAALQQDPADTSPLSPEGFYALPPRRVVPAGAILTSPSHLEHYEASLHPQSAWAEQLPALKGDPYLEVPETQGDRIGPTPPLEDQEALEAVSPVSRGDLRKKFGTLCHRMIERLIAGNVPQEVLQASACQEAHTLFQSADLSEQALKTLAEEALYLAQGFLTSPLGQEALSAPRRQAEFPFILPLKPSHGPDLSKPALIRGAMDLIYESQGYCVIIDFKTDQQLNPESHRVQLSCYRAAAKAFSDLPVKTILVYLRNMQAVPLDLHLSTEELFELAKGGQVPS